MLERLAPAVEEAGGRGDCAGSERENPELVRPHVAIIEPPCGLLLIRLQMGPLFQALPLAERSLRARTDALAQHCFTRLDQRKDSWKSPKL
jgi:hypothetical protein